VTGVTSRQALVDELIVAGRRLATAGLTPGASGNLSVRAGEVMLVTRRGADLAVLSGDDVVEVDLGSAMPLEPADARLPVATPSVRPTKEAGMHAAAYAARPGARAIVHVHSHYATAVACLPPGPDGAADLPPYTPYRVMRLGRVPLVPFAPPGSVALAEVVARAATAAHAMLLAQHGTLVATGSLDEAVADTAELEAAARLTLELRGRDARTIDPADWGDAG
jgi:3-dehydro-4-phosphotetronate decarboxylase